MQIVIDISEDDYRKVQDGRASVSMMQKAIRNGTPLPKHGRLIDKDHMIARLEAASKFFGGENADAFDERFSHGLKEAAIKVAEEPTIIEADKAEAEQVGNPDRLESEGKE